MILITGGAGFIGSVLLHELNRKGHKDILVVDRMRKDQKWKNLCGSHYLEWIHADEFFNEQYESLLNRIQSIYHLGACSSTTERDVDYLMKNNVEFSKKIFNLATDRQIPIVYASSAATYGDGEQGYSDDHDGVKDLLPLNPYGYSKQVFDQWVLDQYRRPPYWYGVKFFNVFGPHEYHKEEMRSLVHKGFEQINGDGQVKLFKSHKEGFEDGKQLRDFVYVRDVVDVLIQLMDNSKYSGIINLGTGQARSFYDLISSVFKAMNKGEKIDYIDMPLSIRNQYQYYTQADVKKLKEILPNFKFRSLEESVEDYVKNFLSHSNPYFGRSHET